MFSTIIRKVFGSKNERTLKRIGHVVRSINALELQYQSMSDRELSGMTEVLKQRLKEGQSLDDLLPDAFAVVRETAKRCLGLRHYDVQLVGGIVLHEGAIAEMRTGEGKTLAGTLPAYLNALSGKGVHIVTVNDYLARRDSAWMKPIYDFLGLSVGVNLPGLSPEEKQQAYQCDITYGTNNEFGFDYLRDNMVFQDNEKVQRDLNFAIIDEVDSILIDEARTPLIISGAAEDSSELYLKMNDIVIKLIENQSDGDGDYTLDEKQKQIHLTEQGHQHVEERLQASGLLDGFESLYLAKNIGLIHHLNAALRAHLMFSKDVDYIVQQNEVVIVDEHTGRSMPGRRWSDGLHQAIEAKEGATIQNENQTLASITFQNFFRLYNKFSGMTGTADTEAFEFHQIYGLTVVVIPTNKPMARVDMSDQVYLCKKDKYDAIVNDVRSAITKKQPVLVGTASIESSEYISSLLRRQKIKHQVLNAKFHEKEAQIIAQAGRPGVVTIATNMAGRGTDIVLGGNLQAELDELSDDSHKSAVESAWHDRHQQVIDAGGLRIIGSERHESRRIDNQLRGRAGRQGDPGSSRFYLSFEDNLLRIFGADRMTGLMQRFGMTEGEAIEHPMVSRRIEAAQRKVEGHNFDIRKQLLEYDNVANEQRKVVYQYRDEIIQSDTGFNDLLRDLREDVFVQLVSDHIPENTIEEDWQLDSLQELLLTEFNCPLVIKEWIDQQDEFDNTKLVSEIHRLVDDAYQRKTAALGEELAEHLEKTILLQTIDNQWREHLAAMDQLRQGIHLRGYAQKDPKQEYKREAFELFGTMLERFKYEVVNLLSTISVQNEAELDMIDQTQSAQRNHLQLQHESINSDDGHSELTETKSSPLKRSERKIGRNEICPCCKSGKKYKNCCGKLGDI